MLAEAKEEESLDVSTALSERLCALKVSASKYAEKRKEAVRDMAKLREEYLTFCAMVRSEKETAPAHPVAAAKARARKRVTFQLPPVTWLPSAHHVAADQSGDPTEAAESCESRELAVARALEHWRVLLTALGTQGGILEAAASSEGSAGDGELEAARPGAAPAVGKRSKSNASVWRASATQAAGSSIAPLGDDRFPEWKRCLAKAGPGLYAAVSAAVAEPLRADGNAAAAAPRQTQPALSSAEAGTTEATFASLLSSLQRAVSRSSCRRAGAPLGRAADLRRSVPRRSATTQRAQRD